MVKLLDGNLIVYWYNGPFLRSPISLALRFSICAIRMRWIPRKKCHDDMSFQALLHAYEEYHLTFELMTSQMEQSV